jgi:ABC-type glycerol-3-phosphate transport system substrate-binding protein
MARVSLRLAAAAAASMALLSGCGFGLEPVLQLVTDRQEMAAYVDNFNATHTDVRVEITYEENPAQAVLDGVAGDLVIGSWLSTPAVMDRLDALADIVKPGKLEPSWFYQKLLAMGSRDNRPFLVPLSFSLPAIVYEPEAIAPTELPPMFMPLDTLRSLSAPFNKTDKSGVFTRVGFSPSWNGEFLTESALLLGARFRPGRNGMPAWDDTGLRRTVDLTRSWLIEVNGRANGSADADESFTSRFFLVQPWYELLSSGRIRFALASFTDFFALPEDKRHAMDFRWLSQDGQVPVLDDVLFAGILRTSRNKAGARTFLLWFANPATQQGEGLLAVNQSRRIGVFAVTNGFSSLKSINEKDLPQRYPLLIGHIPQERMLVFPETLPDNWVAIRGTSGSDGVIWPWILAAASGRSSQSLDKALQDWQNAQRK